MKGRLRTHAGETLVEALASMIVIAIGLTILAGAIVASAHSNAEATTAISSTIPAGTPTPVNGSPVTITITDKDGNTVTPTISVDIYQDGSDNAPVYYYKKHS